MIKVEMKHYNMTLTHKQQKYQHYHQAKLLNMNILPPPPLPPPPPDQRRVIEQVKFTYSPLGKAFEKQ